MTADERRVLVVLAAVVERDDRVLVTRRPPDAHLGGLWEFPGGKCELGEAHDVCLKREILEEIGVEATVGSELVVTEHAYPDRTVRVHFRRCTLAGDPRAQLGQEMRWVTRDELGRLEFPEADRTLIEMLTR